MLSSLGDRVVFGIQASAHAKQPSTAADTYYIAAQFYNSNDKTQSQNATTKETIIIDVIHSGVPFCDMFPPKKTSTSAWLVPLCHQIE
jgi:hypothetical protein